MALATRLPEHPPLGQVLDWSHPLAHGLIGLWLGNEGGGRMANNLAAVRPDAQSAPFVGTGVGWGGGGFNFSAETGSYINAGTSAGLNLGSQMSVIAIIRPTTNNQGAGIVTRWASGSDATNSFTLYLGQDAGNNRPSFILRNTVTNQFTCAPTDISFDAGERFHLAATAEGGAIRLFKNGNASATVTTYTGTIANPARATIIGKLSTSNTFYPFLGVIEAAWLYNRGLRPDMVRYHAAESYAMLLPARATRSNFEPTASPLFAPFAPRPTTLQAM